MSSTDQGLVTKIIDFSFVDGPGNRMAIFLQGCNFNCGYCHNPETINKCIDCGVCISSCKSGALKFEDQKVMHLEEKCTNCDECIAVCPHSSTPKAKYYTVNQLMERVIKVKDFVQGVTVSGGECTLQWQFIKELFTQIKNSTQLTTFIDSNGDISETALDNLIPVTDGFMLDLKGITPSVHELITGKPNNRVLDSIRNIHLARKLYEIRYVVLLGVNDGEQEVAELGRFIGELNTNQRVILIPFRNFGVKGSFKNLDSPTKENMDAIKEILKKHHLMNIVVKT